ncbi:MAG: hypothetical protein KJ957_02705 [Candidatus Omnitrophica bacterium]|nr:hypothetical protein [Candidatus Omnitrophota bacterium]MBU1852939.1 hypothetical protein [Candidatus Omnitrophota bacterium]
MFIKKLSLLFVFILFLILYAYTPVSYAIGHAEILSDEVLDTIYVGGFDFNINAAYAFRSAVASQTNIGAISCVNTKGTITINATNEAVVANLGDSAVANQLNLNAIVAKVGDIVDAEINNLNVAEVANIFMEEIQAASLPEVGVEASSLSYSAPSEILSNNSCPVVLDVPVDTFEPDKIIETGTTLNSSPPSVPTPTAPLNNNSMEPPAVTGTVNKVTASASSVSAQTNIAAVVALNGGVVNTKINNTNITTVENQGNSAAALQTNIAIIIAKNDIENPVVNNQNTANVINTNTTNHGGAKASSLSFSGILMNFDINDVVANNKAVASQANFTFIKSLRGNIKNALLQKLNLSNVFNAP